MGDYPRWQGGVIQPVILRLARRRMPSFEVFLGLEWVTRRILGQPLSLRAWSRMTFNDKVTYRRLRVQDPVFETFCDKLRMPRLRDRTPRSGKRVWTPCRGRASVAV